MITISIGTMRNIMRPRTLFGLLLSLLCMLSASHAQKVQPSLSTEAIINLPVADAWQLFTSDAGLKSLGYASSKVDLRLSGVWQASGGSAVLGSIDQQILSIDPQHMLSFNSANSVGNAATTQWGVLYFTAMGNEMTQLRWLEFFPEAQRAAVASHQQQVRKLFDQLIRRYAPECEVCKLEREHAEQEAVGAK